MSRDPRQRRGEHGRLVHKAGALVVVVLLAVAAAAYVGWIPTLDDRPPTSPALSEPPAEVAGIDLDAPPAAAAVLPTASTRSPLRTRVLGPLIQRELARKDLGRHTAFAAATLGSAAPVWESGTPDVVTPASTLKLLTTLAALDALGPAHRFTTSVVEGRSPGDVVLVGGGDPLLTDRIPRPAEAADHYPQPANLQLLARRTAAALEGQGVRRVAVAYDASLFSGPAVNPRWEPSYVPESIVSPIGALWVDEGREEAGLAKRVTDPAAVAAQRFAALLVDEGIRVPAPVSAQRARPNATELAAVASAPLAQIVQHVLELSDNEAAEVLLRHVALAGGRPGSSAAGVAELRSRLRGLGVDLRRAAIFDGSGLSRDNAVPVSVLVEVLQRAADPAHPQLRPVIATLPVAGFTGSLADRFLDDAQAGLGLVRAKTGTLTGVRGLAGIAVTRSGTPILFAAVADKVPAPKELAARDRLDRIAATLSTCPC